MSALSVQTVKRPACIPGSEMLDVELVNGHNINTGKVACGAELGARGNNEQALSLPVPAATEFSSSCTDLATVFCTFDIAVHSNVCECRNDVLCASERLKLILEDERNRTVKGVSPAYEEIGTDTSATADRNAFCFSFWLISFTSTFAVTGGCASRPPFACGTFAAREPF